MARIRTLKPEFFLSRSLSKVSRDARLTFAGLWCQADDAGRGIADARILKGQIWPLDDDLTPEVIAGHLDELERTGHIRRYDVDDEAYYLVESFADHQAAAYRRSQPIYPEPPACGGVHGARVGVQPQHGVESSDPEPLTDQRVHGARQDVQLARGGVLEHGREGNEEGNEDLAAAPPKRRRPPDPLWDAVMDGCGVNQAEITPDHRGKLNKALAIIRGAGGQPDDVPLRIGVWRQRHPEATCTVMALANHWPELDPALQRNGNGQAPKLPRSAGALQRARSRRGT